jgi:hypothetical protein
VIDWFEDPEESRLSPYAEKSWMRLYIVAALVGFGTLGVIGGMLHVLPA